MYELSVTGDWPRTLDSLRSVPHRWARPHPRLPVHHVSALGIDVDQFVFYEVSKTHSRSNEVHGSVYGYKVDPSFRDFCSCVQAAALHSLLVLLVGKAA